MSITGSNLSVAWTIGSLSDNHNSMFKSLERLSSGSRLNHGADGPAMLIMSKRLQTQIASLGQEIDNVNSAIHKYSTVSSSVLELRDNLTELRTLAIGAANEAFNSEDAQAAYAQSAEAIVESFNKAVADAEYNNSHTLDGSEGSLASISELTGVDLSTPESAAASIAVIDEATSELDGVLTDLGSYQKHELESRMRSLQVTYQNLSAAESTLSDTDYAIEYSSFVANQIRTEAATALLGYSALTHKSLMSLMWSTDR